MDLIRRNTVGDAIRRTARLLRDRSALVFGERDWSFNDLDRAAGRVVRFFADLGLNVGDRIAVYVAQHGGKIVEAGTAETA